MGPQTRMKTTRAQRIGNENEVEIERRETRDWNEERNEIDMKGRGCERDSEGKARERD